MTRRVLGFVFGRCTADTFYRRIIPVALWAIVFLAAWIVT